MRNLKTRISKNYFIAVCCVMVLLGIGTIAISTTLTEPAAKSQPLVTDLQTAIEVMDNYGMDTLHPYMKDDIILKVTKQLGGSSTRKEFLEAYLAQDTNEKLVKAIIEAGDRAAKRNLPE